MTTCVRLPAIALLTLVSACGGESRDTAGSGGAGGASGSGSAGKGGSTGSGGSATSGSANGGSSAGGSANGGSSAGGAAGNCPPSAPGQGSACTPPSSTGLGFAAAHCSWGDDPRPECRTRGLCSQNMWQVTEPDATRCAGPPLPAACPAMPPDMGTPCSDETLRCWYEDGTHCECSPCSGGSPYPVCQTIDPPEWACGTPPAGCPNPLPQAGEPCEQADLSCGPSCEQPIRCQDNVWIYDQANCPICAAPNTPIATPSGERPIAELRVGDLVYSVDGTGIVVAPIVRTGSTPVKGHSVMRLVLENGSVLEISPGHPTANGRLFSELTAGDELDAAHSILNAELVPYDYDRTYDILPESSSGAYFAGGALIGSTLTR